MRIDAAFEVYEVKDIHDKMAEIEAYARQIHNIEIERRAVEITDRLQS